VLSPSNPREFVRAVESDECYVGTTLYDGDYRAEGGLRSGSVTYRDFSAT